jgi:pimeloyl-ACP methyl ester carboxylesterase
MFFQLPWLPEALLSAGDYRLLGQMLKGSARRGAFSDEEISQYRRAWSQPKALSSMLNWYRAFLLRPIPDGSPHVTVPTTVIWGKKDVALRSVMAEESADLCEQRELIWLPDNSHWVQHEAAERVNEILITRFAD